MYNNKIMIFRQRPLLVVLLLVIIIVFAFISSWNAQILHPRPLLGSLREGLTPLTTNVPLCQSDDVPGCYATVQDDSDSSSFDTSYMDKYLLKTELIPPVCPACPSVVNQHSHDGETTSEGSSLNGTDISDTEQNITNITNEETIVNNNIENVDSTVKITEEEKKNNKGKTGATFTDSMLQNYEKTISDLKGQIKNLQQKTSGDNSSGKAGNGECPPCPAPTRCPEPAFSCQKVINYRSPSVGQYLPMPVLNDFSTFPDN